MGEILEMQSVQDYNDNLGVPTLHPQVSVVDMSELDAVRHSLKRFGFYCVMLKELDCGVMMYGRSQYDYQEGTMLFIAPSQVVGADDGKISHNVKGWILMFHPDLLRGTTLARGISRYTFFDYSANEALHLSQQEREIIIGCMRNIRRELNQAIDRHTKQIVVSNIEVLLNNCVRFFDRQFITREIPNNGIMSELDSLLNDYLASPIVQQQGLPTVGWCASQLHLSANYFGDLVKRQTGRSAQEYIRELIIDHAKAMLPGSKVQVAEVAYRLGFKYPQHFSRMFKQIEGISPNEFRTLKS